MRSPMRRPACQSEHAGYERLGVDDECRALCAQSTIVICIGILYRPRLISCTVFLTLTARYSSGDRIGSGCAILEQELAELLAEADADHPIASEVRRGRLADAAKAR